MLAILHIEVIRVVRMIQGMMLSYDGNILKSLLFDIVPSQAMMQTTCTIASLKTAIATRFGWIEIRKGMRFMTLAI
ncbi:MAG: hypothetical protein PF495_03550 [Spirochaetales bacterium]|nr:hypothetical protein [Spirochaetales bacterium]